MYPNSNLGYGSARQMPDYSRNGYGSPYGSQGPDYRDPPPQYALPGQEPTSTRQQYPSPSGVPAYHAPRSPATYDHSRATGTHSSYTESYPTFPGRHTSYTESYPAFPGHPASGNSASRGSHTYTEPYARRSALPSTFTSENGAYYSSAAVGLYADASQPQGYGNQWQSGPSLGGPPLPPGSHGYLSSVGEGPVPPRGGGPPADSDAAIAIPVSNFKMNQTVRARITADTWVMGVIIGVAHLASKFTGRTYWVEIETIEGRRTEKVSEEDLLPSSRKK